ncbi:MAG: DNA recombination protein RmuC [Pseudomonadales bacterium]|nr:DNA recombination protein RmuC [Pseudomonadales bacterium]
MTLLAQSSYLLLLIGLVTGCFVGFVPAHLKRKKDQESWLLDRQKFENEKCEWLDQGKGLEAQIAEKVQQLHTEQLTIAKLESQQQQHEQQITRIEQQLIERDQTLEQVRGRELELTKQLSKLEAELVEAQQRSQDQIKTLADMREQLSVQFKALANEIFEEKSQKFGQQNISSLDQILKPLKERIKEFEKKVDDTYDKESKERFSLAKEVEKLQTLNTQISEDAVNLTNALRGESKTQGLWGEVILERVLEKSGLVKGREYQVQLSMKSEDGKRNQPDVVVHLPEERDVVIDSKVSLVAYERFCSTGDNTDEEKEERKKYLRQHILSIRNHIKDLSGKDYHSLEGVRSLDFVLMFLPVEAAFTLAVQEDNQLFQDAFDKNLIIVGPSTLLATLRTIQNIWRYENQTQNAQEIARQAGGLYDKFVGLVVNLDELGDRLDKTRDSYDGVVNKLSKGKGNLVRRTELLRELGANTNKAIPDKHLSAGIESHEHAKLNALDEAELDL